MLVSFTKTVAAVATLALGVSAVPQRGRHLCATDAPANATIEAELKGLIAQQLKQDSSNQRTTKRVINVHWHVITSGPYGKLSSSQIKSQIGVLNKDYYWSNYHFRLASTSYTENATWFTTIASETSSAAKAMKRALHRGGKADLNLYSADLADGLLGFATFPWTYGTSTASKYLDGVVIHYMSLPSSKTTFAPYNGGRTATHEIGHWLGLYHPFQGESCAPSNPGDYVSDTPQQSTPTYDCPKTKNSCPNAPGYDKFHSFMDYTQDSCMQYFSKGQQARMHASSTRYRGV